jgi:glycosyltransferase involved in cell wall biosynthesis
MLVLCPYPFGVAAGQRLKFEQYYADWTSDGWSIDVAPFMNDRLWHVAFERGHIAQKVAGTFRGCARRILDVMRVPRYDLVYCFMYVTPIGTSVLEQITRRLAERLIYDIEDNVLTAPNRVQGDRNPVLRKARSADKAKYLIRTADHVITSSPFLNDACMKINEKKACTYISSSVDTDRFVPTNRYTNGSVVTVGWTGTFSTRAYLDLLRPVFQELAKRRPFRLRVIGNFDYELEGVDLEVIRWTLDREVADLQGIDIGVYPLAPEEWATGKSGLKAIQYMAFGIPCVATGIGTAPMIIRDGENGLLVQTEQEWVGALERLIDDPQLRRRLGEQARKDAVERYSTRAVAADYRRVLDSVMAGDGDA